MRWALHIVPLLLIAGASVPAQEADTLRVDSVPSRYTSRPVVVDAQSLLQRAAESPRSTTLISRSEIVAANAFDASDVVAFAPGVFVKQYGGLGGLRSVSLRGTSSQQAVILIDGVRYQSSAAGEIDLSTIPADALEQVEVIRGGDAAFYGANALGGVINLVTQPSAGQGLRAELRSGLGSFGERNVALAVSDSRGSQSWSAHLSSVATDGDYPFPYNEFGSTTTIRRENADFSNLSGGAEWSYRSQSGWRGSVGAQAFTSDRGAPGAIVQGNREDLHARLLERDLFSVAQLSYSTSEWSLLSALSGRLNGLRYRDPDARTFGAEGIDNRYDRSELALTLRARRTIGASGIIEASGEAGYARLEGSNLDPSVGSSVTRTQVGGALTSSWSIVGLPYGSELSLEAGFRGETFSGIGTSFSPSLGLQLRIASTPLRLRAHGAGNYRVPSFTEQYYLNYGNADLRPEHSASFDAGVTYQLGESFLLEASGFLIDTHDQIVSVPRSPVSWSAMNVGRVLSRGIEIGANGSLVQGLLELRLSYTRMRAEDRTSGGDYGLLLPYAPEELFSALAQIHLGSYAFGPTCEYVSHRYALPSNLPESLLPHYLTVGAGISGRWPLGMLDLTARAEGSNLFDAQYQVVRNYPMPGRSLRISLELRYVAP